MRTMHKLWMESLRLMKKIIDFSKTPIVYFRKGDTMAELDDITLGEAVGFMKLSKAIRNNSMEIRWVDRIQVLLQCYDKQIVSATTILKELGLNAKQEAELIVEEMKLASKLRETVKRV